jgi:serine/threonine protein kinase
MTAQQRSTRRPPIHFGNYELLERIKIGGMAEILKARDLTARDERLVAIKRILPHLTADKQYVAMFLDESRVLAALHHDTIIRTLEVGQIGETPFLALEYVWGQDARAVFNRSRRTQQPIPIRIACYVMAQVCSGLHYAHESRDPDGRPLGLVHRDVSLQNILISYDGSVKLTDFGIATSLQSTARTQAGVVKGNLGYMSPEQLKGEPTDRRSDVFGAGICLYELLTSERLFSGATDYASITKLRYGAVEPPSRFNRDIPRSLEELVMRALSKPPDERYQSAREMRDALLVFMGEASNGCSPADLSQYMRASFADILKTRPTPDAQRAPLAGLVLPVADDSGELGPAAADPVSAITEANGSGARTKPGDSSTPPARSNSDAPWGDRSASDVFLRPGLPGTGYDAAPAESDDTTESDETTEFNESQTKDSGAFVRAHASGVQPARVAPPAAPTSLRRNISFERVGPTRSQPFQHRVPAPVRTPLAYGAVVATVASIIAIIVLALYLNLRLKPAQLHLSTAPSDVVVRVDGKPISTKTSPFIIDDLTPDVRHRIEVGKPGYSRWSTRLALRSGQVLRLPPVTLTPIAAPSAGPPAEP